MAAPSRASSLAVTLATLAACGSAATPAPPSLEGVASTPRPEDPCETGAAPAIAALVPDLECGRGREHRYALARTVESTILVVALRDERPAWSDGPVLRDRRVLVDGRDAPFPERATPRSARDREALLAAAILRAHGGPSIEFDDSPPLRRYTREVLGTSEEAGTLHLRAMASESEASMVSYSASRTLYDATLAADGSISVEDTLVASTTDEHTTIPALALRPLLARTDGPRPACGDANEAEIRARVPELPPCGPGLTELHVATATEAGELLVVVWRSADGTTGSQAIMGDRVGPLEDVRPTAAAHVLPALEATILAAHRSPSVSFDEGGAIDDVSLAGYARDLDRGVDENGTRLRGVGWRASGTVRELFHYDARVGLEGAIGVTSTLVARREGSRWRIPSLTTLAPIAPVLVPRRVCHDRAEAAIRARLSMLPDCAASPGSTYVALASDPPLLFATWTEPPAPHGRAAVVRGEEIGWWPPYRPHLSRPEDEDAFLGAALLCAHRDGETLALDARRASALEVSALLAPDFSFAVVREDDLVRRSGIGVRAGEGPEPDVALYDARLAAGELYVWRRWLRHFVDGADAPEEEGHALSEYEMRPEP